jgi:hypothetical protein
MNKFKSFLLNEEKSFLGHRVGDVLTAAQGLQDDMPNVGTRHLAKLAEDLVSQIRKILHSRWTGKNIKHLKELQRVGVALQKTIDEKGDLREILPAAVQSLQELSGKLGVRVNSMNAPEQMPGQNAQMGDFQPTPPPPVQPPMGGATPPMMSPLPMGAQPMGS